MDSLGIYDQNDVYSVLRKEGAKASKPIRAPQCFQLSDAINLSSNNDLSLKLHRNTYSQDGLNSPIVDLIRQVNRRTTGPVSSLYGSKSYIKFRNLL